MTSTAPEVERAKHIDVPLTADTSAVEATHAMLRALAAVMTALEPALREPPDSEYLHQYRVALRRSRSVLKQADGIVDATILDEWRPRLRELQRRTNRARDLDVFLLEFPGYLDAVPDRFAGDLEPLRDLLTRERAAEQVLLNGYLASAEHGNLTEEYHTLLAGPLPHVDAPDARRPAVHLARERIGHAYRRVVKRGKKVGDDSPPEALHRVRIAAKELRYLTELYASLLPAEPRKNVVRQLKKLQDNLGAYQDGAVHIEAIEGFADTLRTDDAVPTRTLLALGLLDESFARLQAAAREEFHGRFKAFAKGAMREKVDELLSPDGR